MLKKMKNNKKGFTLVELIVVLVILAILAALLIPALTGYIDKAKEKSIVAETRQAVMATQTLADEIYGTQDLGSTVAIAVVANDTSATSAKDNEITTKAIADLAEVTPKNIISASIEGGKVKQLVYCRNGRTCTYTQSTGKYVVEKKTTER